jgi:phosphoribosylamine--glycine ligase
MKILVIGSGGREHALVHTFHRQGHTIYCIPGNAGTEHLCVPHPPVDPYNFDLLITFVKEKQIDLTVVGPEDFLAKGIANAFEKKNLPLFGPRKEAAILESSKSWAKSFMQKYNIPTARFTLCKNQEEAFKSLYPNIVVKPSGLTGGKGVVCCQTVEQAKEAVRAISNDDIVLEEMLFGKEMSLLAFCDGSTIIPMIPAQDHKRLHNHDKGPNTGGMGAYAPVPFVTEKLMDDIKSTIIARTLRGLKSENLHYVGVIYFGLMLTKEGPKVLEYNCRFGDPETQAILPLLESDLAEIMLACCKDRLHDIHLEWKKQSSCCVVMASPGYPGNCQTGIEIGGLEHSSALVFHASTQKNSHGKVISAGGRVLGITGMGSSLHEAAQNAYQGIQGITFPTSHYRTDIASQGISND